MIRLEDVHAAFGDQEVLRGLDLHIREGETYVLLGPSGAGKSVLLKHLVGLIRPRRGRIEVCGEEITGKRGRALARVRLSIGYVFQSGALINWLNVKENIALPLREHRDLDESQIEERVQEMLDLVHLARDGEKMPDEISGGMKKRVGIARALVLQPRILLFDEPTAGLDPIRARSVADVISDLNDSLNVTNLIVTHNLEIAFDVADRIGFLEKGRISVEGTPEEVSRSSNSFVRQFIAGHGD